MENFEQVTLIKMTNHFNTLVQMERKGNEHKNYEADIHPCRLQVVLQWLADDSRVLHGDGWAREILVSYFGLNKKSVKLKIY